MSMVIRNKKTRVKRPGGSPAAGAAPAVRASAGKTETELREYERRYHRLFEVESDAVLLVDLATGRFIEANAAAEKLYGYSQEEFLTLKPEDVSAEPSTTRQAIAAHQTFIAIRRHRKKDGTVFPVEIAGSYFEHKGRLIHVAAVRDISERVRTESALRESEERFRSLVAASLDAVLLTTPDGKIISANAAACRMFGRSEEELLRGGRSAIVDLADPRLPAALAERTRTGGFHGEITFVRKDGTKFPGELSSSVYTDQAGRERTSMIVRDITERKQTEVKLRASEAKFRLLFEASKEAIMTLEPPAWRFTSGNPASVEMFGAKNEADFLACSPANLSPARQPDGRGSEEKSTAMLELAVRHGSHFFEWTHRRIGGEEFCADVLLTRFAQGEKLVVQATVRDITDRKQAETRLQASEEKFRALFEGSSYPMGMAKDGIQVMVNPAYLALFGYSHIAEVIGKPLIDDIAPEERPKIREFARRRAKGEAVQTYYESRGIRRDGTVFDAGVGVSTYELNGEAYSIGFLHDISERKRAQEALQESEERFHALADSSLVGIYILQDDSYAYVNPAMADIFGYSVAEMTGMSWREIVQPSELGMVVENIRRRIDDEVRTMHYDVRGRYRDGSTRDVDIYGTRMEINGKPALVGTLIDITARKQAEESLRNSREQMRALASRLQAVREEERTNLAREMHDSLAQQLTRLKIDLVWLERRLAKSGGASAPNPMAAKVAEMSAMTDTAIQSVQSIATALRPAVLDSLGLCAAVEWQTKDFQSHGEITFQVSVPEEEPPVNREVATATFRILQECLTNVVRHSRATQGKVSLRLAARQLVLQVADNGTGIAPAALHSPLSIGLAGMRERALLLGGQFDVLSQPGSGTTITVSLPAMLGSEMEESAP